MVFNLHSTCWTVPTVTLDTVNFTYKYKEREREKGTARLISIHTSITIRWCVYTNIGKAISTDLCTNFYESFQPIVP